MIEALLFWIPLYFGVIGVILYLGKRAIDIGGEIHRSMKEEEE
tara:strand:- start:464 stop:592 length:129 start_codon:yes stop_codon:yes gene_type:complete